MPTAIRIRVSIVDPDLHYRLFLTTSLNASRRHILLQTATSAAEARAWGDVHAPDIALIESELPDGSGADLIALLHSRFPQTLFLVLAREKNDERIAEAIRAGAAGYLLKSDGRHAVFHAIDDALTGGAPLSRPIARDVFRLLRDSQPPFPRK